MAAETSYQRRSLSCRAPFGSNCMPKIASRTCFPVAGSSRGWPLSMTRYGRGSSKRSALTWTSSAERASVVRQPTDGLKQPPMHYCTDVPGQFVERAKCGQLVALPHQLIDCDVDQTRRVVHHLRRAMP